VRDGVSVDVRLGVDVLVGVIVALGVAERVDDGVADRVRVAEGVAESERVGDGVAERDAVAVDVAERDGVDGGVAEREGVDGGVAECDGVAVGLGVSVAAARRFGEKRTKKITARGVIHSARHGAGTPRPTFRRLLTWRLMAAPLPGVV
jgi:hypothetical protein